MLELSDNWTPFEAGVSLGGVGSDMGVIVLDEEHGCGGRITLEHNAPVAPFSLTCGIYGRMVHTRFFSDETEARQGYLEMKAALGDILDGDAVGDDLTEQIEAFVAKFP